MHLPINPPFGAPALRRLHNSGHRPRMSSVCSRCHVAWRGEEADCWSCGMPGTSRHCHHDSALQRLLAEVGSLLRTTHGKAAT